MGFPNSSAGKESTCNAGDPGLIPGLGRSPAEGIGYPLDYSWVSLVAQLVKNPSPTWEIWVRSLCWEDPLEKEKATHSIFWPGAFHRLYNPWGCKELGMTEWLSLSVFNKLMNSAADKCSVLSNSVVSNPMDCSPSDSSVHGIFLGKYTGVGCHSHLQGILPTQGSNSSLLHPQADTLPLSHLESPVNSIVFS